MGTSRVFSSFSSVKKYRDISTYIGTPKWMSPEMMNNLSTSVDIQLLKSDIFSLGLVALFCLDQIEFEKQKHLNTDEKALENYLD